MISTTIDPRSTLEGRTLDLDAPPPLPEVQTAKPVRKPPLPALTGIRTLLAFNIVLFHFTPPYLGPLRPFVENGFVFVNVFFLISGYILTYNYSDRGASLDKREFWLARFSRLYPVYLLVLIISIKMVQLEWHARPRGQFWAGMILTPLLLQGVSPILATFWNTVAWTLSCEVALYAAFPWLIRIPWPRKPSRLIFLILLFWIGNMIPSQLYLHFNPDHLTEPVTRYTSTTLLRFLKYTPLPYACTFLAGITLARLQLVTSVTQRQRFAIAAAALTALGIFFYRVSPHVPYLVMHGGILLPLFASMIFGLSGSHPISSIFAWKPILLIGESSYCLYLLHFNVFILLHLYHIPERLHIAAFDPWISYAMIVLLALLVFRFVENPSRRAILQRFSHRYKNAVPTAARKEAA
ncbi:MAG TPA: acyltransferase [Edaphobacter sp.]|nr:acyltransferase [Edaphobacter sp.]